MVFSAVGYTNATTGNIAGPAKEPENLPIIDRQGYPDWKAKVFDKHDPWAYTVYNTPLIAVAGVASGFQQAYYQFEKMPPAITRRTWSQAGTLYGIVAKRSLFAAGIGALFCFTEATVENWRGKKDMTNGMVAGAVAGLGFGGFKPLPQPIVWPIVFALMSVTADLITETIPHNMAGFRFYGPVEGRENWGDPVPPRPPVMDTSAAVRPQHGGHFWRGN